VLAHQGRPLTQIEQTKDIEMAIQFTKTSSAVWEGNGFGSEGASWVASLDGEIVATFSGRTCTIGGQRYIAKPYRVWRSTVVRRFATCPGGANCATHRADRWSA
jgi:hypothetical protein